MILRKRRQRLATYLAGGVCLAVVGSAGFAFAATTDSPARPAAAPVAAADTAGSAVPIPGWLIQSSAQVGTDSAVSQPGFSTAGWYPAGPRSTVYAALVADGRYPDPFYSTNMKSAPAAEFTVPWWYRADLTLGAETGLRTVVDFSGVMSAADVWVNGTQVATRTDIAGVYPRHELDLTGLVHPGTNSIAFKVQPNDPNKHLTMGWIDWAQTPPDQNMGLVRDVTVRRSGAVALRNAHVLTTVNSALSHADVVVKADVRNDSAATVSTVVAGTVGGTAISQTVSLTAHQTKTVTFGTVGIDDPDVWWPAGMGGQPLYDLALTASVGGATSDTASQRFGIRTVTSTLNASGGRGYTINGRPLLITGGGWGSDLLLRWDPTYVSDRLKYAINLGLNTIRLEGHIEPDEFFDMADEMGVLTIPGWECCNRWQNMPAWTAADYAIAKASMAAEGARLRNHPSVITFMVGSDVSPNAQAEKGFMDALASVDWQIPVVTSAANTSSPILGKSGEKMNGPYDWVPPNYWYDKDHSNSGGAWGFNSETSAGPDIPTLDTLNRMMTPSELNTLWSSPSTAQYHRSQSTTFGNLKLFGNALNARYGQVTGLEDYVRKAQLAQYENVRSQFESVGRNFSDATNPATGMIYWMYNSPWTSLHWQLFDRYLDQGGSYYGAKKANQPLHVQYSYDNRSVVVVNRNHATASGLGVKVDLFNVDGTAKFSQSATVSVAGDGNRATALTVPAVSGLSTTYLARLILTDSSGKEIDRNVYWLSTKPDTINWSGHDWYYVPTTASADLSGLTSLARTTVSATATAATSGADTVTTVTLRNTGAGTTPAFFVDAHLVDAANKPVLPVQWTDNMVTLWPGESTTLTARARTSDLHGSAPSVRVSGWNLTTQVVATGGGSPPPQHIEAETGTISAGGSVDSNHSGFTGTGFVNTANAVGASLQLPVTATTAGTATLTVRYSNGTTAARPMSVTVNGAAAGTIAFPVTANWDTWTTATVTVPLIAGANTVKLAATTAGGGPNLDRLEVSS